jgi:hypothetical protein
MRFSTLPKDVKERIWRQRAEQERAMRNARYRSRAKARCPAVAQEALQARQDAMLEFPSPAPSPLPEGPSETTF